jgi:predicted AAA+ superfamily ATPase
MFLLRLAGSRQAPGERSPKIFPVAGAAASLREPMPIYSAIVWHYSPVVTNVFLIGPMGSGKTAVGKRLARALHLRFYDSDAEIEQRTGVDIPYIFEKEGETGFREREREVIAALTRLEEVVIATGGGAVLLPENRQHLAQRGRVVY